jgi:hypothetical protein
VDLGQCRRSKARSRREHGAPSSLVVPGRSIWPSQRLVFPIGNIQLEIGLIRAYCSRTGTEWHDLKV